MIRTYLTIESINGAVTDVLPPILPIDPEIQPGGTFGNFRIFAGKPESAKLFTDFSLSLSLSLFFLEPENQFKISLFVIKNKCKKN